MHETPLLKSLAFKALERLERNKSRNKHETKGLMRVSRPIQRETLHETKNGAWVRPLSLHPSSLRDDYEERIAIAEVDGNQNPLQAHRIAYQDAFISILSTLAEDDPHQDWLAQKIQTTLATLEAQNFPTLN